MLGGLPESVQVQLVVTFGVIIAAIITTMGGLILAILNRTRQHAKATREGVENSHDTNLRDDLDGKVEVIVGRLKELATDVGGIRSDIRAIHREQGEDRRALAAERDRIRLLEDTVTPAQIKAMHNAPPKETP